MKLNETPELIDPIGGRFSIEDKIINKSLYNFIHRAKIKVIETLNDSNEVVYAPSLDPEEYQFQYVGLDNKDKCVCFLSRVNTKNDKIIGKHAYQSIIWTNPHNKALYKLWPSKIIFEHLLPKYKTITTDVMHTPLGMRYWAHLIKQALEKNINVYYYNTQTKFIIKVSSTTHLSQLQAKYKIWEKHESAQNKIMVITTKSFKENIKESSFLDLLKIY